MLFFPIMKETMKNFLIRYLLIATIYGLCSASEFCSTSTQIPTIQILPRRGVEEQNKTKRESKKKKKSDKLTPTHKKNK